MNLFNGGYRIKIVLSAILLISIVEVFLRIVIEVRYGYSEPVMKEDQELNFKFIPNGEYRSKKGVVNFNKYGYIGRDWSIKKDSSEFRIAFVGSCKMSGVFHVRDDYYFNYPELVELAYDNLNIKVETLNFGVPGEQRSYYIFKSIESDVMKFSPNLVLLEYELPLTKKDYVRTEYKGYQLEYIATSEKSKETAIMWAETLNNWGWLVFMIDNSYFLREVAELYQHSNDDDIADFVKFGVKKQVSFIDEAVTGYYTEERSFEMISELCKTLSLQGTEMKMLIYGDSITANVCKQKGIPYILIDGEVNENMFYPNDGHLNNQGQSFLSEIVLKELDEIIPIKFKPGINDI